MMMNEKDAPPWLNELLQSLADQWETDASIHWVYGLDEDDHWEVWMYPALMLFPDVDPTDTFPAEAGFELDAMLELFDLDEEIPRVTCTPESTAISGTVEGVALKLILLWAPPANRAQPVTKFFADGRIEFSDGKSRSGAVFDPSMN